MNINWKMLLIDFIKGFFGGTIAILLFVWLSGCTSTPVVVDSVKCGVNLTEKDLSPCVIPSGLSDGAKYSDGLDKIKELQTSLKQCSTKAMLLSKTLTECNR